MTVATTEPSKLEQGLGDHVSESAVAPPPAYAPHQVWEPGPDSRKCFMITAIVSIAVVLGLVIGLGVGLSRH
ncbi:hypothetical protein EXIGLDRAFT_732993 [Exidia glandulosa HHB12029]|uniref:Uncharacterized protein n=1 Tax=Exidia glandulosa HHB12029 TaxID=1314781 RepID=A0A165KMA9_EXIGL|nr:hypothetical protein EXIGLDRAFT_732993 [Exidia glandulosa HHB12029]